MPLRGRDAYNEYIKHYMRDYRAKKGTGDTDVTDNSHVNGTYLDRRVSPLEAAERKAAEGTEHDVPEASGSRGAGGAAARGGADAPPSDSGAGKAPARGGGADIVGAAAWEQVLRETAGLRTLVKGFIDEHPSGYALSFESLMSAAQLAPVE